MRLIDGDKFLEYLIFSKHIDSLTCHEVKEAIEMCKVDVLEQIRAEIAECLEAINHIKAMPIQLYTPNEIEARKLTYEQCLGFIDKYKTESENMK